MGKEKDILVNSEQLADILEGKLDPRDADQSKPLGIAELGDPGGDFGTPLTNLNGHADASTRLQLERKQKLAKLIEGYEVRPVQSFKSITQVIANNGARIRVWRNSTELPEYNELEIQVLLSKVPSGAGMQDIFDIISTIEGVTACELTDPEGCGAVAFWE